jgi:thiamine-monophosphate kinase
MESNQRTEIASLGEFGLIEHLTRDNETLNASTLLSVGDDAAVIDHLGKQTVITTDLLMEGIHFDLTYTPLKHLGYKAVAVNLSDLCAMMATPTHITVSIAISNRFSVEALDELYSGIYAACERYSVDLIGGDTSTSMKGLVISVTAIGEVTNDQFITRSGARPNDLICVSGDLGGAYLGLQLLEREKRIFLEHPEAQPELATHTYCLGRLLKPEPRTDIVSFLQEAKITPTSMIDVSDGLSSELLHICRKSGVGCVVYDDKIPVNADTKGAAEELNLSAVTCSLSGGEDYELLFTVSQSDFETISKNSDIAVIGYITEADKDAMLQTKAGPSHKLTAQGWNAFR